MVTVSPNFPLATLSALTVGSTVKVERVPVPPAVVIDIGPVVASVGTVVRSHCAEGMFTRPLTPWKPAAVALTKYAPWISTCVPQGPDAGVKERIVGTGRGSPS